MHTSLPFYLSGIKHIFKWYVQTFLLVSTVYAVAIGEPNFGNVGPLIVGLSLFTMVFVGESSCSHTDLMG